MSSSLKSLKSFLRSYERTLRRLVRARQNGEGSTYSFNFHFTVTDTEKVMEGQNSQYYGYAKIDQDGIHIKIGKVSGRRFNVEQQDYLKQQGLTPLANGIMYGADTVSIPMGDL